MKQRVRLGLVLVLILISMVAGSVRAEEVTFTGSPIPIRLEPGRLTELVFPREVLDVVSDDEVLVATKPGDAVVYVRPAHPAFQTSLFVRLDGGYSIPIEVSEATDGHPTISLWIGLDKHLKAIDGLARGQPDSAATKASRTTYSPIELIRAMYLDQPLAGYSVVDGGSASELERPELAVRRVKSWLSPTWDGLVLDVENKTDQPLHLDPMSFQGQGSAAPRYVYLYSENLASRPTLASAEAVGAHRTRVLLVRPAARPAGAGRIPRRTDNPHPDPRGSSGPRSDASHPEGLRPDGAAKSPAPHEPPRG